MSTPDPSNDAFAVANPTMAAAALAYARRGLPVYPIWPVLPALRVGGFICGCGHLSCDRPGKHPLGRLVPHGLDDATTDEARVRHLWACRADANIGFATGAIIVIDFDPRHGGTVAEFEQQGPLPPTWRVTTGSGGEHLYFRAPAGVGIRNSVGHLGSGIDVRGAGGYVVTPPSLHISGQRYSWQTEHAPGQIELAPLPTWISEALAKATKKATTTAWHKLVTADVGEGARNVTITKLAGHLLRHYVDPHVTLELVLAWNATRCCPPLLPAEVAKTVNSICNRELRRREANGRR